jgi:hypothetical protein
MGKKFFETLENRPLSLINEILIVLGEYLHFLIVMIQMMEWIVMFYLIKNQEGIRVEEIMYKVNVQKTKGRLSSFDFIK